MITREELDALAQLLSKTPLTIAEMLWWQALANRMAAMIEAEKRSAAEPG